MAMMRILPVLAFVALLAFLPAVSYAAADAKASASESAHQPVTVSEDETSAKNPAGPAMATGEAEAPHEASADHGEGGLPQLNIATYPSQIFWLLVMFVVLYTAFSKSILPAIGGVVNARESLIKGNLDEAQRLKEEAESIQASYEKSLEYARAQAVAAVQDVEKASKKKAADQVETFRKRAESDIGTAEQRVNAAKDKAMSDMTGVAAEVASIAAEKITGVSTDRQKAQAIVETIAGKAKAA